MNDLFGHEYMYMVVRLVNCAMFLVGPALLYLSSPMHPSIKNVYSKNTVTMLYSNVTVIVMVISRIHLHMPQYQLFSCMNLIYAVFYKTKKTNTI